MRTIWLLSLAALGSGAVWAQAAPEFEVASIRPWTAAVGGDQPVSLGVKIDGAQFHGTLPLKDFIASAYRVKLYQVSGPDWLASTRFEISAKLPAGETLGKIPEMLQALLVERFQLKMHREKKDFPVYALEVGKNGLKMQESDAGPAPADPGRPAVDVVGTGSAQGISVNLGGGASYTFSNNRFEAHKLDMANFTATIERFLDRPVLDRTNLKGRYDFALDVTEEDYRNMLIRAAVVAGVVLPPAALQFLESGSPVSLFNSIEKLGLKADSRKEPLDLLVIDSVLKAPTEN